MACPICQKRKAKRFCPARDEAICSICCGTEREVTINCPADCPHLVASRRFDAERREFDWSKLPFAEHKIPPSFARNHGGLLDSLVSAICAFAGDHPALADPDVIAATTALAESFSTLAKGIYYEKPPALPLQLSLYDALKSALRERQKAEARQAGFPASHDSDLRDALIALAQLGAQKENGRPQGRAFLDLLRRELKPAESPKPASNLVVLP